MDIVRTNLQRIRGQIQVDTQPGVGTTFTISVPLTLSVVRILLVESGGLLLAFPTSVVEEMVRPSPEMVFVSGAQELLNWEGYMVPLFRLHQWFQFARPHAKPNVDAIPAINEPTVLLLARGTELVGLEVERYWGEQEVTIRSIEGILRLPPGLSSCTILGDGRVVPLVDAPSLLSWLEQQQAQQHQTPDRKQQSGLDSPIGRPTEESSQKPMVMVVDDSINVRRFLALTLEKAGYGVQQAKDGQEALERLEEELPIQAVICDIEMPRLDGYGFLAQVKSHPVYKQLPVIMLTSRSGEKHRQIAMNLGACAYFSKPFQEQELLKTLNTLTHQSSSLIPNS